jgi:hypothetical protein
MNKEIFRNAPSPKRPSVSGQMSGLNYRRPWAERRSQRTRNFRYVWRGIGRIGFSFGHTAPRFCLSTDRWGPEEVIPTSFHKIAKVKQSLNRSQFKKDDRDAPLELLTKYNHTHTDERIQTADPKGQHFIQNI